MSDLSVFQHPIIENGIKFYVFPEGYPLFKAKKGTEPTEFRRGIPSFFGIKNMLPEYIDSYEEEYGVIFEYITTRPYKLVALDDESTQEQLRSEAPPEIQKIIDENYGLKTKYRDSVSEKDRMLANYLCERGYEGYATQPMKSDSGGTFHIELLICDAVDGIQFVTRVTDSKKISYIMEKEKLKQLGKELENKQKQERIARRKEVIDEDTIGHTMLFEGEEDTFESPIKKIKSNPNIDFNTPPRGRNLFGDDDDDVPRGRNLFGDDDVFGGKKRRKTNRRKKNKNKRKSKKHRKSYKKKLSKK